MKTMASDYNQFKLDHSPDQQECRLFVETHPYGNIFQHPEMAQLFASIPQTSSGLIAVRSDETLAGILCYAILQEPGMKGRFSRRSIIMGGPLTDPKYPGALEALLKGYLDDIAGKGIIYTEIRNHFNTEADRLAFEKAGFLYNDHLNICIDLEKSEEDLIAAIHKKRWSNIRRGLKKGVQIKELEESHHLQAAYELVRKTYQRVNVPLAPPALFLNASRILKEKIRYVGAFHNDTMIASRVYLIFKDTIYDWYAGSDEQYFNLHPNDILPWEIMKQAKQMGMKCYDFGGAGKPELDSGVRTYKERFGGQTLNHGRYKKIHQPLLYRMGTIAVKYYNYIKQL